MKKPLSIFNLRTRTIRSALVVAGLATGLGMGTAPLGFADDAMPKAHSDGMGTAVADTAITAKVKSKLMGEAMLKQSDISVTTTNGVVTLEGSASSSKAKSFAESQAKMIEGVKSVDNNLKDPDTSKTASKTKRVVSDSWITTKVKSEILANSVTKGFKVGVETMDGVVLLKGTLANQDAVDHVKDIAGKVEGVKSVDTSALTVSTK